jgi:predicted component of type VI protein secretion system
MGLAVEVIRTDTSEHETISCAGSPVRIGRSPLNNVVLAAPWVSLHHGLIHFDEQRATYSDLGSTNGTNVFSGDQEMKLHPMVPFQILGPGQKDAELRIGAITMRLRWEHTPELPVRGGKRGFDTRLTHSEGHAPIPVPTPSSEPPYRSESPYQQRPAPPSAPGGRSPFYVAGNTRMVMPGEQERIRNEAAGAVGAPLTPSSGASGPVHEALARMTNGWAGAGGLHQPGPERAFAETLAAVADAFARGLIELKNGVKEFGDGVGVRAVGGHSPLHRAQTAGEVTSYLLDPQANTHDRLEQLVDLFADLGIHEMALLAGVKAGVRKLLAELDPEKGYARASGGGAFGLLDRSLKRYREHFDRVAEDDGASVVFGPEFARAYAAALGTDTKRRG